MLAQLAQGILIVLKEGHEMSLLSQKFKFLRKEERISSGHQITEDGGREWENFIVIVGLTIKLSTTTHGVNCTGSCSWNIYVKNELL